MSVIGMFSERRDTLACFFCGGRSLRRRYTNLYHRIKTDHGPFDFYECSDCQSGLTFPMPSGESLKALYQSYTNGLPEIMRELMGSEGELWHFQCVQRIRRMLCNRSAKDGFTWIDVGAGGGEMAGYMAAVFPNSCGLAIDRHERPNSLPAKVDWLQLDLNSPDFHHACGRSADLVYATAVWEHVTEPHTFVQNMSRMLIDGGMLYLVCPNYASLTHKILGTRWPYFAPGEHLAMPSPQGAVSCLKRAIEQVGLQAVYVRSRPIMPVYSLFYAASRFNLPFATLVPRSLRISMPAGALESIVILDAKPRTEGKAR